MQKQMREKERRLRDEDRALGQRCRPQQEESKEFGNRVIAPRSRIAPCLAALNIAPKP